MKRVLQFVLLSLCLSAAAARATTTPIAPSLAVQEEQRKTELRKRLCTEKQLSCDYVNSIFADPRLKLYEPPAPAPPAPPSAKAPISHERNPYLTERFGLLTPESIERCRSFIKAHALAFEGAYNLYGVPKEVICGHMRIETNFGIATRLSPNPFGLYPAVNRLISLYVRKPKSLKSPERFLRRQQFALEELTHLLVAGNNLGWDLFTIPGSPTGAIGLVQFEPSSFSIGVDGDGDGKVDFFNPDDAILSIAHYLVTRGWDQNPEHQKRAVYSYYGGHYDQDSHKYYMKAVLEYAAEVRTYLKDHPVEADLTFITQPLTPPNTAILTPSDNNGLPTN